MADAKAPPDIVYDQGIYIPQLDSAFIISKDPKFDYYSTNIGMYPKNPGGGGGGGGGGSEAEIQALKREVRAISNDLGDVHNEQGVQNTAISRLNTSSNELSGDVTDLKASNVELKDDVESLNATRDAMVSAAVNGEIDLSSIKTSADIYEIDDIINNQAILSSAQYTLLNAINAS